MKVSRLRSVELRTKEPVSTLYSPTHPVQIVERWESGADAPLYHVRFELVAPAESCERDLEVLYKARAFDGAVDVTVLAERPVAGEPGTF